MLEWLKRAKKRSTAASEVSAYDSRCGRYRVEVHVSTLECDRGKRGKRKQRWYALVKDGDGWTLTASARDVRTHSLKTRAAAERECDRHAAG